MSEVSPGEQDSHEYMGALQDFDAKASSVDTAGLIRKDGTVELHDKDSEAREAAAQENEDM